MHFYVSVPDNILIIILLLLDYIIAVCKYAAIKYTVQILSVPIVYMDTANKCWFSLNG